MTFRRRAPNIYTFVFLLVILVFRFLVIGLRLIRRINRYLLSIVYSLIAKRTLAPLRVISADSSPVSLKRTSNRVVFQTNRTLFAASTKIDSTILIYVLSLVFLVLIISFIFLYYRVDKVFLIYYIFVLYKINRNTQVIIIFFSEEARGLFFYIY
jgi:hypothetical protein